MQVPIIAAVVASSLGLLGVGLSQIITVCLARSSRKEARQDKVRSALIEVIAQAHQLNSLQQGWLLSILAYKGPSLSDFLDDWVKTDSNEQLSQTRYKTETAMQKARMMVTDEKIKQALDLVKNDYERYFEEATEPLLNLRNGSAAQEQLSSAYAHGHIKLLSAKTRIVKLEQEVHAKLAIDIG